MEESGIDPGEFMAKRFRIDTAAVKAKMSKIEKEQAYKEVGNISDVRSDIRKQIFIYQINNNNWTT